MKIYYQVSDGYAGGKRTQTVKVDDSEIAQAGNIEDAKTLISDAIQEHFLQNICPYWDESQYESEIARLIAEEAL